MPEFIYPPRPKGKMNPSDLPYYESTGQWCVQRKFKGTRNLIHITPDQNVSVWNRHYRKHDKFSLNKAMRDEILSLNLKKGTEYWLDSELMNKVANPTNEIILYDVLQAGKYFFAAPDQMGRLEILREICGNPEKLCSTGIALEVTPKIWMAQTWTERFVELFNESLPNPILEGLVLRKKKASLDNFGNKEYETGNMIRCRKPFADDKGYNF